MAARARRAPRTPWPWRLLGLASVALFAAISLRPAFSRAGERLARALANRPQSAAPGPRRCLGAAFIAQADRLRGELAPGNPYYLVEGDDPKRGGALLVRFELAPRPALFLGTFSKLAAGADPARLRRRLSSIPVRRVVVA